jgi:hypothetical protein
MGAITIERGENMVGNEEGWHLAAKLLIPDTALPG